MLKGIPSIISPELLKILMEMGHGDEICIADGNFPGAAIAQRLVRCDGHTVPAVMEAILKLMPLDTYQKPAYIMQKVPGDTVATPIWDTYKEIVAKYDARGEKCFGSIERGAFYDRTREKSCAVIMSGESALYANIILKKGVVVDAK